MKTERKYTFQDSLAPDDGKKKRTTSKNLEVSLNKIMKYEILHHLLLQI